MVSWTATSSMRSKIAIQDLVIKGKLVPSSSCAQEDSDCNESGKEFDEGNDDRLEDSGQDLMWYIYDRPTQDVDSYITMKKLHN